MKIGKIIMLSMIGVGAMVSCSEDELGNDNKEYGTLQPVIGVYPGQDAGTSRAGETAKWRIYEELYPLALEDEPTIGIFMTQGNAPMNTISGKFVYKMDDSFTPALPNWTSTIPVEDGTTYNIFGYMSANNTSWDASVTPNGTDYSTGAVMQLNNLEVVTASDVSVVVGVLKGNMDDKNDDGVMRLTVENEGSEYGGTTKPSYLGSYSFVGEKDKNFIYLWLDHLYACINFELTMDDNYGKLRIVKLKNVELKVNSYKTYNVTVALGIDSTDPIDNVHFEQPEGAEKEITTATLFQSVDGQPIPLKSEGSELNIPGYFAPASTFADTEQTIDVTFTYDLYSVKAGKEMKLVEAGRKATNKINIGQLLQSGGHSEVKRGMLYTVRANIQPTYLYVLADEDLDNPTFELEVGD